MKKRKRSKKFEIRFVKRPTWKTDLRYLVLDGYTKFHCWNENVSFYMYCSKFAKTKKEIAEVNRKRTAYMKANNMKPLFVCENFA